MAVVRRWVEVASREEIDEAIDIPSPAGTALCMAAALKKDREAGRLDQYCAYPCISCMSGLANYSVRIICIKILL